jgi:hypothetical protein
MSGNNTTIHSTTTMEFPRERQEAIQKKVDARSASTAHFMTPPKAHPQAPQQMTKVGQTPHQPTAQPQPQAAPQAQHAPQLQRRPMMQPVLDDQPQAPRQAPQPNPMGMSFNGVPAGQAQVSAPTVPVEMPGFTNAIAEPEGTSLALPSRFAFYNFKDLYASPFRAKHLAKLQRAHREQSLLPLVEAVSSILMTTTPGHSAVAFDLTLPDFYFVLYWLRLNSFTKSNYTHKTTCNNEAHMKRVEDGYKLEQYAAAVAAGEMSQEQFDLIQSQVLPEDSLQIAEIIRQSTMVVKELEEIPNPEHYHFSDTSAMFFRPPTMRDVIEFQDAPQMQDKATRTEFAYLAQMASHIQHQELLLTLAVRVDIVGEATADQVQLLQDYEQAIGTYGVDEEVVVTCKGCGASRKSKLILDAFSFLSPDKRG